VIDVSPARPARRSEYGVDLRHQIVADLREPTSGPGPGNAIILGVQLQK